MRKRLVVSFYVSMICSICFGQRDTSHSLSLKQCVEAAIKNNPQVQQSDLQSQTAAINLKQAKADVLPDLFGNLSHGINQGRSIDPFSNSYINQQVTYASYSVNSTMVLFNGFQLRNLIQQNKYITEAAKLDVQQAKDNVMLNVILAYLQILSSEEQLQQAKNQAEVTRGQVHRLRILNDSGAVAPGQLYDLQGQLATDELVMVNAQNTLNNARLSLSQLMNVPYEAGLQVEKITTDTLPLNEAVNTQMLYQTSSKQLPLVKAADMRIESARRGVRVAKGIYYPTLGFSGAFNTYYSSAAARDIVASTSETESGDYVTVNGSKVPVITTRTNFSSQKISFGDQFNNNYNTSLFLSLQIPILNRYRAKNRVALARVDLKNAELTAQTIKTQLSQNIEQAHFNMTAAVDRYNTLQQQVKDFSESFRIAEVRFNAGAINQVDYLIAKNNVERARINLINAKYDYVFRRKILSYYEGVLKL